MAQGIREVTNKRGFDPREFPLVVAGGAGPLHSCLIADELEIPFQIVPRESSIFCAAGMLMSDLRHDFVRTFVSTFDELDWGRLETVVDEMRAEGARLLGEEGIAEDRRSYRLKFDCRYLKQYHEVSFDVPWQAVEARDLASIAAAFHAEHNRLFGYSLEDEGAPVEIINLRLQAIGITDKPEHAVEAFAGADAGVALKGERAVYIPEDDGFRSVPIYDGHKMRFGHRVTGPAMIEQVTTAIFVGASFDCVCDQFGSFVLYRKGREDLVATISEEDPS